VWFGEISRDQFQAVYFGTFDETTYRCVRVCEGVDDLLAPLQATKAFFVVLPRRRDGRKRARFVADGADGDTHGSRLPIGA
jgi:hypothetical protein